MTGGELIALAAAAMGGSAFLSVILLPQLIRLALSLGLVDRPARHKRHTHPTPFLGGAGLFITFWGTIGLLHLCGFDLQLSMRSMAGIAAASTLIYLMGQFDDIRPIGAPVKLIVQSLAGGLLVWGGMSVGLVTVPFSGSTVETGFLGSLLSVVWVVALCNAINLIDGIDLLAGGVSLIAALLLTIIGVLHGVAASVAVGASVAGFCLVFLRFNRPPARLFLGDAGSQQLGLYFAILSLVVPLKSFTATALYLPLLTLIVPLIEIVSSFVRRVAAGRNPLRADRQHLFHLLARLGLNNRQVLVIFFAATLISGLGGLLFYLFDRRLAVSVLLVFLLVAAGMIGIFDAASERPAGNTDGQSKPDVE